MASKTPAKKTTTASTKAPETKAPAAKSAKQDHECCGAHGKDGKCCRDGLDEALHDEMEDSCGCGHDHGHDHANHDHEAVHKTAIKPRKPNTSGIAEDGNVVVIHYTGTLDSGEEFDTSKGRDPIEFMLGSHSVIPGFEKAIVGMKISEKKKIDIESVDAYGDPNPELMQEVPKAALGDITPEEGMMLALHHPMSPAPIPVKIAKVGEETVTIDMNHPLAGKRLHFELELVAIR